VLPFRQIKKRGCDEKRFLADFGLKNGICFKFFYNVIERGQSASTGSKNRTGCSNR
jgi:hypothetical protein